MASSLKFGTSGLRGLVSELTDVVCRSYTAAFIGHLRRQGGLAGPSRVCWSARDLRASSPDIAAQCIAAASARGRRRGGLRGAAHPSAGARTADARHPRDHGHRQPHPGRSQRPRFYQGRTARSTKPTRPGSSTAWGRDPPGVPAGTAPLRVDRGRARRPYQARYPRLAGGRRRWLACASGCSQHCSAGPATCWCAVLALRLAPKWCRCRARLGSVRRQGHRGAR